MRTTYVNVQIPFLIIPSFKHLRHSGLKKWLWVWCIICYRVEFMLLQYWSLVWFIWSTSARGFNNSVCSEFRACVFIKILFCSKGFSMTQITGSFCNCVLPTPLRGCHIFIYKDLFTIFPPWIEIAVYYFIVKILFPSVLTLLGLTSLEAFLRSAYFT